MTQQELADKIGVTDRAISKWENGRGMPNLSLMIPLCKELDITINELISGEKIEKKDYQSKLEENILKTIDYTNRRIINKDKIFKIVVGTIITIILIIGLMFFVDVNRMNNKDPVIFSTCPSLIAPASPTLVLSLVLSITFWETVVKSLATILPLELVVFISSLAQSK